MTDAPAQPPAAEGPATTGPVGVHLADGVLEIVLDRPRARNALGLAGAQDFLAAASRADEPGVSCVLLRAEGEHFCVGGDLQDFADAPDVRTRVLATATAAHEGILALADAPVPVVTAVQGWAAGIGVSLATLGDVVLAAESARFRSAYTAIGFTPDGGLTHRLPALVGPVRAADFVLTNRPLDAAEAAAWGLVSRVVPDADLLAAARALARQFADGPRQAHRIARGLLRAAGRDTLRAALDAEAAAIATQADHPEGREGLAAFLAHRSPDFGAMRDPAAP